MQTPALKITAYSRLSKNLLCDIAALNALAPDYELYYEPMSLNSEKAFVTAVDDDKMLTGFLSFLWIPGECEAELTALVHPLHRGRGIFTRMLDTASAECERLGIQRLYYTLPERALSNIILPDSALPNNALSGNPLTDEAPMCSPLTNRTSVNCTPPNIDIGAKNKLHQYSHSEYLMKLDNCLMAYDQNKLNDSLEKISAVYIGCNGRNGECRLAGRLSRETLCRCRLADEDSFTNIYDVETPIQHRRKGFAALLMQCVIADAAKSSIKPFVLQVSSRNPAAFCLYKKLGFKTVECVDYYSITCSHS